MNNILYEKTTKSAIALANAIEIASAVITNIVGNDISSSVNGNTITSQTVKSLIMARINSQLENKR